METRFCIACNKNKDLDEFKYSSKKSNPYYRKDKCNKCYKAYYRKMNKEKIKIASRKYLEKHKEKIYANRKILDFKNKDKIKEYRKKYAKKNKEKISLSRKLAHKKNYVKRDSKPYLKKERLAFLDFLKENNIVLALTTPQ